MNLRSEATALPRYPAGSLSVAARIDDGAAARSRPLAPTRRRPAKRDGREPEREARTRRRALVPVRSPGGDLSKPGAAASSAPDTTGDPARWQRFEALVLEAGVSRERLLEAFPHSDDIEDILQTPEADLAACAATIVRALAEDMPSLAPSPAPVTTVRCADCRHFARSATHPRLGRCGAGESPSAAGGWWDTQRRHCLSFVITE